MSYEDKLKLILKVIKDAEKAARKNHDLKLYVSKGSELNEINLNEVNDILLQLQDNEKVVTIKDIPTSLKQLALEPSELLYGHKDYFSIETNETFDTWYSNFLLKERSQIENLSGVNLKNITYILPLIEQELELSRSNKVVISFVSSGDEISGYDTYDIDNVTSTYTKCLSYLKSIGVIEDFTSEPMSVSSELTVNVPKFFEALEKIKKLNGKTVSKTPQNLPQKTIEEKVTKTSDEPVYEITFTTSRVILLNKAFQLAKPDFDSENELVFSFLYEHPNKKYIQEEIEQAVGRKITKSIHKIVENLGFTGELKKVFIDATKTSICFRNPITKADLEKLGVTQIRLPR